MKKLIYFYCEDLRGFEDTEFNFSSKYKIHFDKDTGILTINKGDENYIDNFYSENIELNAIVGNNGVGKSTLFKGLHDTFTTWNICYDYCNILVFQEVDIFIYFISDEQCKMTYISSMYDFPQEIQLNSVTSSIDWLLDSNITSEYITQTFDQELYGNYSLSGRIRQISKESNNFDTVINFFLLDQFKNQYDFLVDKVFSKKDDENKKIKIPFKVNTCIEIDINYNLNNIFRFLKFDKEISNKMEMCLRSDVYDIERVEYDSFLEGLLASFIYSAFEEEKINVSEQFLLKLVSSIFDEFKNIEYKYKKVEYFFSEINGKTSVPVEPYQNFLKFFNDNVKFYNSGEIGAYSIPFFDLDNDGDIHYRLKEFYENYSLIHQKKPFLEFLWGLSSGETAMLDLYSKFYQIYKSTVEYNNKNPSSEYTGIILLIDEADAYFHPQWQKDYVKDTLNVAKQIFEGFGVQIILATHSPIMLSDIPKQNVLYLKKEENAGTKVVPREERQETFGANIFSLFKDTFFLEGSGIGSFAEENLEELLKRIHDLKEINEEEIEYIKKRIMMIGDPFIRQKFENEFCICIEKKDSQRSLDEKIRFFEKEIESLKKQKERDKNDKD